MKKREDEEEEKADQIEGKPKYKEVVILYPSEE